MFLLMSFLALFACTSAEKHNKHLETVISVEELRKDIEFAKNKLLTKHVDIDLYHSKDVISARMDSFKIAIKPMKPNDFSIELSKVIATFGHAHTSLSYPTYKFTKEQRKAYKKSKSPFTKFEIRSKDQHAYLYRNLSSDSTLNPKAEILAINQVKYEDFYRKFNGVKKGDGYITTFGDYALRNYFLTYVRNSSSVNDSIELTLKLNDSIYTKIIQREYLSKKKELKKDSTELAKVKKDSIPKKSPKIKLTKEEKLKKKEELKHQEDIKKYLVYKSDKKEYLRELSYPNPSDSTTAILKIKSFSVSHGKKAYPFIFDSIKQNNVQNLILDLRDNTGGYVNDINYLYSFLTTKEGQQIVHADEVKVRSKTIMFHRHFNKIDPISYTLAFPFILYHSTKSYFSTKKKEDGYYMKIVNKKSKLDQENKFKGNLYVLTNGLSFSASTILSSSLQNEGKAIFVGEESGGDYNGTVAGQFVDYKLPNSKLKLNIGIMTYRPNTKRELKGRGNLPDQPVKQTLEDIINEKDPQLDWILDHIKSQQK